MSTRKAILGQKLGMTQVFDEARRIVPVTVVHVGTNVVSQVRSVDTDGYAAVQVAFGHVDPRRVSKPVAGHFEKTAGVPPRRHVVEFRTDDAADYTTGQELTAEVFEAGQLVDVIGTTKGKGYAGVMKRHGFHGKPASHGVEKMHRSPGSIGACATPARVFKGTRMAGRMGHARHTTQNLRVQAIDLDKGLVLVRGAIPGPVKGLVLIQTAAKAPLGRGGVPKPVTRAGGAA